jgi:hypothetical protein
MTYLKKKLIQEIETFSNLSLLQEAFNLLRLLRTQAVPAQNNRAGVLGMAGVLNKAEADEISSFISAEFSKTEGEW